MKKIIITFCILSLLTLSALLIIGVEHNKSLVNTKEESLKFDKPTGLKDNSYETIKYYCDSKTNNCVEVI